tara:strand:- start:81 stop:359 length:279 start_codon:yes stop_codon:yes gene_type:complete
MMVNGQKHDEMYRKRLARDAEQNANEDSQQEQQQTAAHQTEDGMKPEFIQKLQTSQFGVQSKSDGVCIISMEENMRRKRASQQTGDRFMEKL